MLSAQRITRAQTRFHSPFSGQGLLWRPVLAWAVYSASTGLLCTQCHEKGDWKRVATDRMRLVPRMNAIFPAIEPFMPPQARTQCYMCHQGKQKPEKNP